MHNMANGKAKSCCPIQFSSVLSLSRVRLFATPWTAQHVRLPCPSPTPRVYSNSRPLCQWCHPTTSSSAIPFSSCLQSFPASGSFPRSPFFASDGQSIAVSASASVLPMTVQEWFPLAWTGLISLQSKGLLRVLFPMTHFYSAHLLPGHKHTQSQFSLTCQDLQFFLLMFAWCCKGKEHKGTMICTVSTPSLLPSLTHEPPFHAEDALSTGKQATMSPSRTFGFHGKIQALQK